MTDYAAPVSPADAMRRFADHLDYRRRGHEDKAAEHVAIAKELTEMWREALKEADAYDTWQPKEAS